MFVLADMEWMANENGHFSPTQLAAVKVDENWNIVDKFESFIRPRDTAFHDWEHVAYTGGTATDFLMLVKDIMFSQHSMIGYLKTILSYGGI